MIWQIIVLAVIVAAVVFWGVHSIVRGVRGGCCGRSKQTVPPACQGCSPADDEGCQQKLSEPQ